MGDTTHGKAKKGKMAKDKEAEAEETRDLPVPRQVSSSEMTMSVNQRLQEVMATVVESHTVETAVTVETEVEEVVEVVEAEAAEMVITTLTLPMHRLTKLKIDNSEELNLRLSRQSEVTP